MARRLKRDERNVLMKLLGADFVGAEKLRAQVPSVSVVGGTPPTWLDLVVHPDFEPSEAPDGHVPGQAWVYDDAGNPIGTILVWISNGYLSALEYGWMTDEMPTTFPSADAVRLTS